jgi:2-polyprenyl-3-methyl-5-hydroxy-6-metoxy-1,4-benzoquinol methylase
LRDGLLTRIVFERVGRRDVVGLDPDPAEAELARSVGLYTEVHAASVGAIPEADASFDWVLANSVLEHILTTFSRCLRTRRACCGQVATSS